MFTLYLATLFFFYLATLKLDRALQENDSPMFFESIESKAPQNTSKPSLAAH